MSLPPELIVTIEQTDANRYLAKTLRSNQEEVCRHTFDLPADLLVDLEPQWLLDKAIPRHAYDPVKGDGSRRELVQQEIDKLARLGQRLYAMLFGDGAALAAFLRYNDAYGRQVRLTLAMHSNAAALWRQPWEYLHDGADFLTLQGRFLLSRRPYGLAELDPPPATLPLRILVVVSAPEDQPALDSEEEIAAIQAALDAAVREGQVQVHYLDDATLEAIGQAVRDFQPHVLHYTGHGRYDAQQARSYLALEDDQGRSRAAGIAELRPYLLEARSLHLVLLSGCQTAQTSAVDAFSGVATGLLQADLPAVLAMQFSLLDISGICLARAFYAGLARGESVTAAVQQARLALRDFAEGPGYDWGVPALYLRARGDLRLVDAEKPGVSKTPGFSRAAAIDMAGLPLPPHFVGRKAELRSLRHALRAPQVTAAFVRAIGGMGKSALAAKLIERPGVDLDGVLVIRCHEVDALDIPARLAAFLAGQGKAGHAEAAGLLLDSTRPPAERARLAAAQVRDRRYLLVFDNFESVQHPTPGPSPEKGGELEYLTPSPSPEKGGELEHPTPSPSPEKGGELEYLTPSPSPEKGGELEHSTPGPEKGGEVADATLRGLLEGLLGAQWRSLCLFTGRFRWPALDAGLGRGTALELHLPELSDSQAIMLMDNLPRLRRQELKVKIAMLRKVGGHPHSIELLEGWLASGRVSDLLHDASLDHLLREQWEGYFLQALLARLAPAQREALARLSIFRTALAEAEFAYAGVDDATVRAWLDLSLVQREQGMPAVDLAPEMQALLELLPEAERRQFEAQVRYTIHPVVRESLLAQQTGAARQALHRWAAAYYGQPFVEMARRMVRPDAQVTEQQLEALARSRQGAVGQMVARTDDLAQARGAMARALEWQHQLFAAGDHERAGEIVTAVWLVLARWGQRDRAKALLRGSIATLAGGNLAVAQSNLANLLMDEGKLDEALATYEAVYATFAALNARQQMAAALSQIASVYQRQGKYENAIEYEERSLALEKERDNEEGQAISLHQLSMLCEITGEYATALARSQAAEALFRKLDIEAHVAATLHEQGLIYNEMADAATGQAEDAAVATPAAYRTQAFERFQQSLAIKRRIGDEAGVGKSLGEIGKLLRDANEMAGAIVAFSEALEIAKRMGDPVSTGIRLEFLGSVHERQGQYAAALEKYEQALALFKRYSHAADVADTERNIVRVRAKLGGG